MDLVEARKITSDERRNHILDIAHEAFMQDGYSGTSMSRIAGLLGGSKTTLYNYFASKKELFVAVSDRECAKLLDQIFVVAEVAGDFRSRVSDLARRVLSALMDDHSIASLRLIVAEAGRFPEVGQAAQELGLERGLERLSHYFQHAIDAGEMRRADPHLAAEQFLDLVTGGLHRRRLWNVISQVSAEAIAAEAERITNTFLAAFGNDELSRAARAG